MLEEFGFDWDSSLMGREFELYRPRRVEVNYESASVFGAPAKFVEIPLAAPTTCSASSSCSTRWPGTATSGTPP